jgi:adenylate cyclase
MSSTLPYSEVERIGRVSAANNKKKGITGVLIFVQGLFFQLLEGDEKIVDELFAYIKEDERHEEVMCLKTENNVTVRLFPEWSMKMINLDRNDSEIMMPIRILLQNVMDSHSIILKYTQPAVSNIFNMGLNPLDMPLRKTNKVIVFGDIVSFSRICENRPVEEVSKFINYYFEICSNNITAFGGEVTKFMGDGIMAFYDIDKVDKAMRACVEILNEISSMKQSLESGNSLLHKLRTGFGISCGEVMEGNMGSSFKKDYTVIGDVVNVASRLEAYTRKVEKAIVFSEDVEEILRNSWDYSTHGKVELKGKAHPIEIFSLNIKL